jgi:hypothetical protein
MQRKYRPVLNRIKKNRREKNMRKGCMIKRLKMLMGKRILITMNNMDKN